MRKNVFHKIHLTKVFSRLIYLCPMLHEGLLEILEKRDTLNFELY
jgi:hypothetical protein